MVISRILCCRGACSIQLEESVIITGGQYSRNRVEQYNLAGSMGRLPDLNTGRENHACGHYLHNGEVVSTNIIDIMHCTSHLLLDTVCP